MPAPGFFMSSSSARLPPNRSMTAPRNDSGTSIRVVAVNVTSKVAVLGDADVEVHNDDVRLRPNGGGFWGILVFTYTIEDSLGRQSTAQGTITLI